MDNEQMARFISELRKSQKMTQKELAEKLNVTDKAVSKWERGLSYPDISLLSPLAEIFGITTNELLKGQRNDMLSFETAEVNNVVEASLQYADKATQNKFKNIQITATLLITFLFLIALFVCSICNFAISGTLTWALYPICALIFAWLIVIPPLQFHKYQIRIFFILISFFLIPFLFTLNFIIGSSHLFISLAVSVSIIALLYLWSIYFIFTILKTRKCRAAAISVLLSVPVAFLMNFRIGNLLKSPTIDVWDVMSYGIAVMIAFVLFYIDYRVQKQKG